MSDLRRNLHATVKVYDSLPFPCFAKDDADLYMAVGYLLADQLWQMDMRRDRRQAVKYSEGYVDTDALSVASRQKSEVS
jgi:acyl-homoserine lactone acylase PvdQ